jgi:hypothetical protein
MKSLCVRYFDSILRTIVAEHGQALPIVLAILSIGSLTIGPFLYHAGTNLIASTNYKEIINETYASEAGVEQAIWQLEYGTLADDIPNPGDSISFSLTDTVNNLYPKVTVTLRQCDSAGNGDSLGNRIIDLRQTYLIQSIAGNNNITAVVQISEGIPRVISWVVDRR